MTLANLIEAITEWDDRDASVFDAIARDISEAGFMPRTPKGGISWTAATNLLIAANTPYMSDKPAASVPIFRGLKKTDDPVSGLPTDAAFTAVSAARSFGDAIDALLQDAVRIREWFVVGESYDATVNNIAYNTRALRVSFRKTALPSAMITVQRAEGEPIYSLSFSSTDETVCMMSEYRPGDREIEVSVGFPTVLTIFDGVLGRRLLGARNHVTIRRELSSIRNVTPEEPWNETERNEVEIKICEALRQQRHEPGTVGNRWERNAKLYPEIAVLGYEARVRGEWIQQPFHIGGDTYIDRDDERWDALEFGFYLRDLEPDRPRDSVDELMEQSVADMLAYAE
jgi:hypothetical protein